MSPSALKRTTSLWFISTRSWISRANEPWFITASLSARYVACFLPSLYRVTLRIVRLSNLHWFLKVRSRTSNIFSLVVSDMNPKVPMFTPRIGVCWRGWRLAILRIVPSPPRAMAMSHFRRSCSFLSPPFSPNAFAEFSSNTTFLFFPSRYLTIFLRRAFCSPMLRFVIKPTFLTLLHSNSLSMAVLYYVFLRSLYSF